MATGQLAVITGASSGIGYELARCCASGGYDLVICADEPEIEEAAAKLRALDTKVDAVQADLATMEGVDKLLVVIGPRPVDALLANAGRGLGHAFLDQDFDEARKLVDLNITGTIALVHRVGRGMRERNQGRILITGSIAGFMPGSFQAVYNGTKAFLDNFSMALRNELKDTDVTVTCLMPGPTETDFFERADMEDTKFGKSEKADPADVARKGYEAMMAGKSGVVTGFMNKVQTAFAGIIPDTVLAEMHRRMAEPDGKG
ncbi:SDR family NAD(P)-dependent oxidoreductase [Phyllobacteriaceae bacterium JZ32]